MLRSSTDHDTGCWQDFRGVEMPESHAATTVMPALAARESAGRTRLGKAVEPRAPRQAR